jgi:hypothetical protein
VVPGLLRARRRQRPGQRPDAGRARRRRVGGHRAEGVDVAGPPGRLVLRRLPDRSRDSVRHQGPVLPAGAHGPARRRGAAHHPAHPDLGVQRGVLRRRPHHASTTWWARWATAGGGARHPGLRAGRGAARPPARLPARARPSLARAGPTGHRATRCSASAGPGPMPSWRSCAQHPAEPLRRRRAGGAARGLDRQAVLGQLAPPSGRAGHGRPRVRRPRSSTGSPRTAPYELGRVPASFLFSRSPRPSTAGPTRSSATSSASGSSACRPSRKGPPRDRPGRVRDPRTTAPPRRRGHGLLTGKVVVVTAAAGTGIGFATAGAVLEEGASVVISDAHERRLGEAAEQLASGRAGRDRIGWRVACDVTDEAQVQRALRRRGGATRPHRRGRATTPARRARCRGGHDRRAVVAGPRRHPHRHVPLHPGRAPPLLPQKRAVSSSTTPRCSVGGPRPARRTTPRPRPA